MYSGYRVVTIPGTAGQTHVVVSSCLFCLGQAVSESQYLNLTQPVLDYRDSPTRTS